MTPNTLEAFQRSKVPLFSHILNNMYQERNQQQNERPVEINGPPVGCHSTPTLSLNLNINKR